MQNDPPNPTPGKPEDVRPPLPAGWTRKPERSAWAVFGITCGVILAVLGLVLVGLTIAVASSLNNYGSNK